MHQYHQPRAYEVGSFRRCFQHGRHLGKVEVPPSHGEGCLEGGVRLLQLVQASVPVISNAVIEMQRSLPFPRSLI